VRLAANAGLSAAFHAGFTRARGDIVATMDSDLQNDPREISRLLSGLDGADAVVGWRRDRRDPWPKRISSRFANAVRNAVTDEAIKDSACSLRVMRRECLEAIPPFDGMHRFVPTLLKIRGFRVIEVAVPHRPRRFGYSKYGIRNRALRTLLDLLVVRWMMTRIIRRDFLGEPERSDSDQEERAA
jgi:glycosyltransferase involved in cell wall biosynthesis